ncbi:MAG: prepilin-type N-terminal cleavage/methylation domain-containing protein [Alphaproteobacteria bacterium]|nr:prepilin-type N-terminal cleavage/methylation domain-containing protein [Alphaproteobacteria bacterium]
MKNNQSGRSMIEMLCVLSIIGVLTVGAIAGYRRMISKYYANKTAQYITTLVTEIKTAYSQQPSFNGISNETVMGMGIVPKEFGTNPSQLRNPYGGVVNIFASNLREVPAGTGSEDSDATAILEFGMISREVCLQLITQDWASQFGEAVIAIAAGDATKTNVTNMTTPISSAGGAYQNKGLDYIYLDDNTDYTKKTGYYKNLAIGIARNKHNPIPVRPAYAAQGCNCYDPTTQETTTTCSFAIKFR